MFIKLLCQCYKSSKARTCKQNGIMFALREKQLQLHAKCFFFIFWKLQGESQKWKGKGLAWQDAGRQNNSRCSSSPIIFSSERRGISHVSPWWVVLLYNIKTYWLQSNKELEWQIKKEIKSGVLESWSFTGWEHLWLLSDSHLHILQH